MEKRDWKTWFRRLGVAGFWFFLIKGLVYAVVGIAVYFGLIEVNCS